MNTETANKLLQIANKFCQDNLDNKLTEWSNIAFLETIKQELIKIVQADQQLEIENQKKIVSENNERISNENKDNLIPISKNLK
jgi:hypothetical protein